VAVSWSNEWLSAGPTSGGQLVQGVVFSWSNEWRSAGTKSGFSAGITIPTFQLFQHEIGFQLVMVSLCHECGFVFYTEFAVYQMYNVYVIAGFQCIRMFQ